MIIVLSFAECILIEQGLYPEYFKYVNLKYYHFNNAFY